MSAFTIPVRVYYEDTDAGGIVYHASYLRFCERARTDWLRGAGVSQEELLHQEEGFVIARMSATFKKSARLDDLLSVSCVPLKSRRVSVTFLQQVRNAKGELLFEMESDIAYVDKATGGLKAIPAPMQDYIHRALESALGDK